jgi:type VI secretion system protein ImpM
MSRTSLRPQIAYFGKIPTRGDFVKSSNNTLLLTTLDKWVAQGMELISEDSRWKMTYDELAPLHFAFLGSRSKLAIAGHLMTSSDASQRRFPFLSAAPLDVDDPMHFIARCPLILSRLWSRLHSHMNGVLKSTDPIDSLQALEDIDIELDMGVGSYDANFGDFVEMQTIGSLESMLAAAGHQVSLRRAILALGLLLQPVMSSGSSRLAKGLSLPLPADPMYRNLVASLWLEFISKFLGRADFELALYFGQTTHAPRLVLGFNGSSAKTLHSFMDKQIGAEQNIFIDNAEWVEDQIADDYSVSKLSSYLGQPQLSLRMALQSFSESFLGT